MNRHKPDAYQPDYPVGMHIKSSSFDHAHLFPTLNGILACTCVLDFSYTGSHCSPAQYTAVTVHTGLEATGRVVAVHPETAERAY